MGRKFTEWKPTGLLVGSILLAPVSVGRTDEPIVISGLLSPPAVTSTPAGEERGPAPVLLAKDEGLTLAGLEAMALEHNPTLEQAAAQVTAASGTALQAGLPPNPIFGYTGEQIGSEGTIGEMQGVYVQQEIVTGGKLRLSRAKYLETVVQAELQALAQRSRVLNGVRIHFYRTLTAQRRVELQQDLLSNAEDGLQTAKEMVNLGQANTADLLQARVEQLRHRLELRNAEFALVASWRSLAAIVGVPSLEKVPLEGDLEPDSQPLQWDSALARLLEENPQLLIAKAEVRRDRIQLRREQVQLIPNVTILAQTGYNFTAKNTTATVSAEIPLPILNRNQGTIQQARSELARSHADVRRLELLLGQRLANVFRQYRVALLAGTEYKSNILPAAKQAYELLREGYRQRRAPWPDVLMAQRTWYQLRVAYLDSLLELREAEISIRGLLLAGGLGEPPMAVPGGHIDATPQPR